VTIVGFGASAGGVADGAPWAEGTGRKRYTNQTIANIDTANAKATATGEAGNSACFGDSGGPLFMQLADGSWRMFGVASTAMLDAAQECGAGSIYQLVAEHVAWVEQDAGVDLSACFDDGGAWAPAEACGEFPLAPGGTEAVWADSCATDERGCDVRRGRGHRGRWLELGRRVELGWTDGGG
jgi:trypsin